jgi:multimeric flavodoxin WrbA
LIFLKEKNIEFCDGCLACERTGACHKKDDMLQIIREMKEARGIVFGTPTYWDNVSSLFKTFLDRTVPLYYDESFKNKHFVGVAVGEAEVVSQKLAIQAIKHYIKDYERPSLKLIGFVVTKAKAPGEIKKQLKVLEDCYKLGQKLTASL